MPDSVKSLRKTIRFSKARVLNHFSYQVFLWQLGKAYRSVSQPKLRAPKGGVLNVKFTNPQRICGSLCKRNLDRGGEMAYLLLLANHNLAVSSIKM